MRDMSTSSLASLLSGYRTSGTSAGCPNPCGNSSVLQTSEATVLTTASPCFPADIARESVVQAPSRRWCHATSWRQLGDGSSDFADWAAGPRSLRQHCTILVSYPKYWLANGDFLQTVYTKTEASSLDVMHATTLISQNRR